MWILVQIFLKTVLAISIISPCVEAVLPTLTENDDPALHGLYTDQTREEGDVLIPYGINLQGGVRYYVDWDKKLTSEAIKQKTVGVNSVGSEVMLNSNMNCKTLFSPGKVYYRTYALKGTIFDVSLDTSGYRDLEMKPIDHPTQTTLNRIRACCSPSPPCSERCFEVAEVQAAAFTITAPDGVTILMSGRCTYCAIKSCTTQCSEGEFATNNAIIDEVTISRTFRSRIAVVYVH